ncbi:hypothetical protein SBA4_5220003 [Candidatus Sulfopaludibacter sp. SbA4]|nr:hypothetical protein SBA4_5220003 [Candidatus Sulfopaludibacter sp. SbA4]
MARRLLGGDKLHVHQPAGPGEGGHTDADRRKGRASGRRGGVAVSQSCLGFLGVETVLHLDLLQGG